MSGKPLEEVAGVTPVFVVNMPNNAVPGFQPGFNAPGSLSGKGTLSHTTISKAKASAGLIGGTKLSKLGYLGAGAVGTAGVAATAAGAAGYGVGTLGYNYALKGTDLSDDIGRAIAKSLAFFGNENAQAALDAEERANAHLKIEVEDNRVNVKSLNAQGMDAEVYGGYSMAMP